MLLRGDGPDDTVDLSGRTAGVTASSTFLVGGGDYVAFGGLVVPAGTAPRRVRVRLLRRFAGRRVERLVLAAVPSGAKVTATCAGRRCPFRHRGFRVRRRRAVLTGAFRHRRLAPGSVVTVRVRVPGRTTEVIRIATLRKALRIRIG